MTELREEEKAYVTLTKKRAIRFPFELSAAGVIWTSNSHSFSTSGYDSLEFCLRLGSKEAEAVDELGDETYRTRFPHLLIKRGGIRHSYTINESRHAIFLIYPTELETEFARIGVSIDPPAVEFSVTPEMETLFEEFYKLIQISQNHGSAEKLDILGFRIIESIFMQRLQPDDNQTRTDIVIREIASYLQLNFANTIDINALCRRFGISRRSFFRNWSKHYDQTPFQYILDLKLREAERLLLTHDIQVKEVAANLGFENYSYFIQVFRRSHNGMTPGKFHELHANK